MRMFVDYAPSENCENPYTYGCVCVKCEECGRMFDEYGVLMDEEHKTDINENIDALMEGEHDS